MYLSMMEPRFTGSRCAGGVTDEEISAQHTQRPQNIWEGEAGEWQSTNAAERHGWALHLRGCVGVISTLDSQEALGGAR